METSSNPLLEAVLFGIFIILACAVPLILAYAITKAAEKRAAKKPPAQPKP